MESLLKCFFLTGIYNLCASAFRIIWLMIVSDWHSHISGLGVDLLECLILLGNEATLAGGALSRSHLRDVEIMYLPPIRHLSESLCEEPVRLRKNDPVMRESQVGREGGWFARDTRGKLWHNGKRHALHLKSQRQAVLTVFMFVSCENNVIRKISLISVVGSKRSDQPFFGTHLRSFN